MKIPLSILAIALSGCAHPMKSDLALRLYEPTVVWSGPQVAECTYVTSDRGGHLDYIGVILTVDGHPSLFAVDTGSGKTLIRPEYARKIGVKVSDQQLQLAGGGSKRWRNVVFVDQLDFGFARIEKTFLFVADLHQARNNSVPPEDQFEGILGLDILTALGAKIEVSNHKIRFRKPPNQSPEATPGERPPLPPSPSSGAPQL